MRTAIVLCFTTVLYTVYAPNPLTDDLERVKLQIESAIENVHRTIQQLERLHADTKEDTISEVTKRWWEQMDNYRDYVNLLISSMRREVNNAKSRGTDAQDCYDTNLWAINQHSDTAYKTATKCQESAEKSIQSSLAFLNSLTSLGDELIKELNDLFLNCHSEDTLDMQSCILVELGKITTNVKNFEEDAKYIVYSVLPASNYVVLQASQCLTNVYLLARFESQSAMLSNSRCVRDALNK